MAKENKLKITTGVVRLSYAHIWEPYAFKETDTPKYSVRLIIPKSDTETVDNINRVIDLAIEEGVKKGMFNGKKPNKQTIYTPLRDGDVFEEDKEEFANAWFINAKSKHKPQIVDRQKNDILDPEQVYSGCYAKVSLVFFPYDTDGGRGVSCILCNIQKVKDGESFTAVSSADDDFEVIEDNDDILG